MRLGGTLAALSLATVSLQAANKYWDTSSTAGLQAGAGTWDTGTTPLWSTAQAGTALTTWSAGDTVFLDASGFNDLTLGDVSVAGITFEYSSSLVSSNLLEGAGPLRLSGNISYPNWFAIPTFTNQINVSSIILNNNVVIGFIRNYGDNTAHYLAIGGAISENGGPRSLKVNQTSSSGTGGNGWLFLDNPNNTFSGGLDAGGRYVIARAASGTPLGTGNIDTRAGAQSTPVVPIELLPQGSGTAVSLSAANALTTSKININGSGLFVLNKGQQNSLTFTAGNAAAAANSVLNRVGTSASLVVQYNNTLGVDEQFIVNGGVSVTNGITTPYFIGQKGTTYDFLIYNTLNGLVPATYDYTNTFTGAGSNNTVVLTANTTLTGNANAHAVNLRTGTLNLGGNTLTLGDGFNPAGLLLNGTISSGTINVPTELAATVVSGAINAAVTGSGKLVAPGAGSLTLSGNVSVPSIIAGVGTIALSGTGNQTITSVITASGGALNQTGTGTNVLSSSGNAVTSMTLSAGTFKLDNSINANPSLTVSGTMDVTGSGGNKPVAVVSNATVTVSGQLRVGHDGAGIGELIVAGASTFTAKGNFIDMGFNGGVAAVSLRDTAFFDGGTQILELGRGGNTDMANARWSMQDSSRAGFGIIEVGNNNNTSPSITYGTLLMADSATLTGTSMLVGDQSGVNPKGIVGIVEQRGGTITLSSGGALTLGNQATYSYGTYNLSGGTLNAGKVVGGAGKLALLNFHGGTLAYNSNSAQANFIALGAAGSAYVYEGGAIDTGSTNVTVAQNLLNPSGNGVVSIPLTAGGSNYIVPPVVQITNAVGDTTGSGATAIAQVDPNSLAITNILISNPGTGYTLAPVVVLGKSSGSGATLGTISIGANTYSGGLTKLGTGTLTLSGANTYTGTTTVGNGTLLVTGSLAGGVSVNAGTRLGGTGTIGGASTVASGGDLAPGNTNLVGTLSLSSDLTLQSGGTCTYDLSGTYNGSNDKLVIGGNLNLNNNTLNLRAPATLDTNADYVLMTVTGTISGSFNSIPAWVGTAPGNAALFSVVTDTVNHQVVLHAQTSSTIYTIAASAGVGGSITPSGTVQVVQGQNQTFTMTPNAGCYVIDVQVDGSSVGAVSSYTFNNVQANHTIVASFITTYTITPTAGANGTITPGTPQTVTNGNSATFAFTPASGYGIDQVLVDGVYNAAAVTNGAYTFSNVTTNHTISVSFGASISNSPAPVAWYQFENNLVDTMGNYNGTGYNNPSYVPGNIGADAIQFSGSQYASIQRPVSNDWTIAFWVKTTQPSPTANQWYYGNGLVDGECPGATNDFGISYLNSKVAFGVGNPDTTLQSVSTISNGTWIHVACTRNSTNGLMSIYINGLLENSTNGPTGTRDTPANLHFGNLQTTNYWFNGALDQVKIYNVVLGGAAIRGLASESNSPTSIAVVSSLNPSGYGDSVSFTATISPSAADGTVQFLTNGTAFGAPVALSAGQATSLATTSLPRGTNTITVQYSGSPVYGRSTNTLALGQAVTNHPPVAQAISMAALSGIAQNLSLISKYPPADVDGDTCTITAVTYTGNNGATVSNTSTGITYTAASGFTGSDTFDYTVTDGYGGTNTATVTVSVATATGYNLLAPTFISSSGADVLNFVGNPGYLYSLQHATNLVAPVFWQDILTNTAGNDGSLSFTNIPTDSVNFYRTRALPNP